jgi:hypothetical protein
VTDESMKKEAAERWADAKEHKALFRADLEEAYYFVSPTRRRQMEGADSATRPSDKFELMTSLGIEVNEDFGTLVVSTFFPKSEKWVAMEVSAALPSMEAGDLKTINDTIEADEDIVFDAINASNLRTEIAKTFTPDVGIGTVGLHIDPRPRGGVRVLGVPLNELFIVVGPDGSVDDRFWERATTARRLYGLVPALKTAKGKDAEKWRKKLKDSPRTACTVKWGWWRDWTQDDETWVWVVMIDGDVIDDGRIKGEGSCPLIVGRFGASPEWAYGNGPTLKCLPEFRTADELSALLIENVDHTVKPPMTWPNDSFMNVETGVESGKFYAVGADEAKDVRPIYDVNSLDPGYFELERTERRIKRIHFVDKPEQRGDTPPTLGQWMSEMELGQRRFGVPGDVFWHEMPRAIFLRFRHILEKRGVITPIMAGNQNVMLSAVNPAQRAQDMQEVANAGRFMEIGGQAFPEEFKVSVDGTKTLANMRKKMGVEKIIEMRNVEDVKAAVAQISQLTGGAAPGVTPSPGLLNGAGPPL